MTNIAQISEMQLNEKLCTHVKVNRSVGPGNIRGKDSDNDFVFGGKGVFSLPIFTMNSKKVYYR